MSYQNCSCANENLESITFFDNKWFPYFSLAILRKRISSWALWFFIYWVINCSCFPDYFLSQSILRKAGNSLYSSPNIEWNPGLSSLGVPWHPQILADQLTLYQPRGADSEIMPTKYVILAASDFQIFRRPWSQNFNFPSLH